MKILIVSLLRLGDVLLSTAILRSLKLEFPNCEIHLLINGQFKSVAPMIPYASKVYCFERDCLQQLIGEPDHSLLEAYFRVEDLVEKLKEERYDKVINLTHNRLSGWLAALVGAQQTHGVVFGSDGKFSLGSSWFEYLNDHTRPGSTNAFHFVDVFHYGAGVPNPDRRIELKESDEGRAFAEALFKNNNKTRRVVIQPFSNEVKKTFSLQKWRSIAQFLQSADPQVGIYVLGSPSEVKGVETICKDTPFIPVVSSLDQAYSILSRAQLLVTCDTSIKHLASATKIKILEVSLGSSEFRKTGAYVSGAVIIQGNAPCAPCPHRSPCSQKSHECADHIPEELVALAGGAILRQDEGALRMLAHEFKDDATLLKTQINAQGDWAAYELANDFSKEEIIRWVDRASSKLFLEKVFEKKVGEFGSEGLELKSLLQNIFPDRSWREWVNELSEMEKRVMWFEDQIVRLLGKLKEILSRIDRDDTLDNYVSELRDFCVDMKNDHLFRSYSEQLISFIDEISPDNPAFLTVKHLRERLVTAHQRSKIELKLIRGLQNGFMEVQ